MAVHLGPQVLSWRTAAAALAVVAAALGWRLALELRRPPPPPVPQVRLSMAPPAGAEFTHGDETFDAVLAAGPTSELIAVASTAGVAHLWRQPLGEARPTLVPGTDGATWPADVPGRRAVSFFRGAALLVVDLVTGARTTALSEVTDPAGAAWLTDGSVLLGHTRGPLTRATGGISTPATRLHDGEASHRFPVRLDDERWIYLAVRHDGARTVRLVDGATDTELVRADGHALAVDGWLLYPRSGALLAQRLDIDGQRLTGRAEAVVGTVAISDAGRTQMAVSARTIIAAAPASSSHRVRWFEADGTPGAAATDAGDFWQVRLSPDDRAAAVTMVEPLLRTLDVYVLRAGTGALLPVSLGLAAESNPVWSPDGASLLYRSSRGAAPAIYMRRVGVPGSPEDRWLSDVGAATPSDWTRAGEVLFWWTPEQRSNTDVWRRAGGAPAAAALASGFNESDARVSPDARRVAFVSDEGGQPDVYVTTWPPPTTGASDAGANAIGGRARVSQAGGSHPRWLGTSLLFLRGTDTVLRVDQVPGTPLEYTVPRVVLTTPGLRDFDAAHRSARLLVVGRDADGGAPPVTAVVHWLSALGAPR